MTRRRAATGLALGLAVLAVLLALARFEREPPAVAMDSPAPRGSSVSAVEASEPSVLVRAELPPVERRTIVESDAAPRERRVRGRVRGPGGEPVADAWVTVTFSSPRQPDARLELTSDARGRFEWTQPLEAATFSLRVQALGLAGRRLEGVRADGGEVEVMLARGAFLLASEASPALDMPTISLRAAGVDVVAAVLPEKDGRFRIGPLPAGVYSATCSYPWSTERLVIGGIVVRAGEDARDERLDPLDLSRFVTTVVLTVVDERGEPVPDVVVGRRMPGGAFERLDALAGEHGALRVESAPSPLGWRVEAPGFRPLDAEMDRDGRVVMRRGPKLRIVLAGPAPQLPEGWQLAPRLTRLYPRSLTELAPPARFVGGVAELTVDLPGRYDVSYELVDPHGRVGRFSARDPDASEGWSDISLRVVESEEVQDFALRPPSAEGLRRACERLNAKSKPPETDR